MPAIWRQRAIREAVQLQPVNAEICPANGRNGAGSRRQNNGRPPKRRYGYFSATATVKSVSIWYMSVGLPQLRTVEALLTAVERAGVTIAMIGGGTVKTDGSDLHGKYESQLRERFGDLDGRIHWLGRIKNHEIPLYINQAKAFILCSLSEGQSACHSERSYGLWRALHRHQRIWHQAHAAARSHRIPLRRRCRKHRRSHQNRYVATRADAQDGRKRAQVRCRELFAAAIGASKSTNCWSI